MALIGAISRDPSLQLDDWLRCIGGSATLVAPNPQSGKNPFTGAPKVWEPRPEQVDVVLSGVRLGAIEPGAEFEEDGILDVYGDDPPVEELRTHVNELARTMEASVMWFDEVEAQDEEWQQRQRRP